MAKVGQTQPKSERFGRHRSKFGQPRPQLGRKHPQVGRNRSKLGRETVSPPFHEADALRNSLSEDPKLAEIRRSGSKSAMRGIRLRELAGAKAALKALGTGPDPTSTLGTRRAPGCQRLAAQTAMQLSRQPRPRGYRFLLSSGCSKSSSRCLRRTGPVCLPPEPGTVPPQVQSTDGPCSMRQEHKHCDVPQSRPDLSRDLRRGQNSRM